MTPTALATLAFVILSARSGQEVSLEALAAELATRDVVFLGEEHDNTVGHRFQLQIIEALHRQRRDLVVSMEMFERDAQGTLNDYLAGRIGEKTFKKHARCWPNYEKHYRAIIEYAKESGLQVIAANAPRQLVRQVSAGGLQTVSSESFVARSVSAPRDRYFRLFEKSMADHPGGGIKGKVLDQWYQSQCLRDDTMAESIHDFRRGHPARRPLIVHLCGKFHSDHGLGTVSRLLARDPLCQVAVVSMQSCKEPGSYDAEEALQRGHYLVVVPEEPKKEKKKEPDDGAPEPEITEAPAELASAGQVEAAAKKAGTTSRPVATDEAEELDEEGGRAALGLMPAYEEDDDPGVLVDSVTPGKGAEAAGLEAGDRIVALDGESIVDLNDYMDIMGDFKPGQTIKVKVKRGAKKLEFKVKLGRYGR